jgi:uncharacterized protein (DUF433 family)
MDLLDRIELNPRICNGKPVIKGTRIPVSVIIEQIAEGESWDAVLAGYPELKKEDIQAALQYARVSIEHTDDPSDVLNHSSTARDSGQPDLQEISRIVHELRRIK